MTNSGSGLLVWFAILGLSEPGLAQSGSPAARPPIAPVTAPAEPDALPLYATTTGAAADEDWTRLGPVTVVRNVTRPTLTPVLPAPGKATGAAVIVAPGGGSIMIAMDDEGWKVAHALADRGIAAFVLKYRIKRTPRDIPGLMTYFGSLKQQADKGGAPKLENPEASDDARRAVEVVRRRAGEWGIDPHHVGMLGFSSGGRIERDAALASPDATRPDFLGIVYGGLEHATVSANAPPLFAAVAIDDPIVGAERFEVVGDWIAARRPVELHAYQTGGHGFALGRPGTTTTGMLDQFVAWLTAQGFMTRKDSK